MPIFAFFCLSNRPFTLLFLLLLSNLALAQPTNDNCSGAIELPVGGSCTFQTFTNVGATASPNMPSVNCPLTVSYNGGDIWFKATVPANGRVIVDTEKDVITDAVLIMYSGTCSNLSQLECNDDADNTNPMPLIDRSGLTPGSTVFIRFFDNGNSVFGTFKICAHSPGGGPIETKDMAVLQVTMPPNGCTLPSQQTVKMKLKNNGNTTQSNFQVSFSVNGGTPVNETVTTNIAAGAELEYSFTNKANVPVSAIAYSIVGSVVQSGDQNTGNNNASTTFSNRPLPNAQTVPQTIGCQGVPLTLSSFGPVGSQYQWSNGAFGASISVTPTANTSYRVSVTDPFGCTDVDTVAVTVSPLPAQPVLSFSGLQLCAGGGSVTLTSSIATNIVWSTGATSQSIIVTQAGNYWVKHIGPSGCERVSATVTVQQVPPPTLVTQGVGAVCPGGSETITVSHPNGFSYQYVWSNGATSQSIQVQPTDTTIYSVTVTNATLNCQYILQKNIFTLSAAPPGAISAMLPANGAQNLSFPITLSWLPASNASHYNLYIWKSGDPEPSINNPSIANITGLNYTIYSNLNYNTTYNWRLLPKTPCNTGTVGPVQTFKLAQLPNLVVSSINVPTGSIFSGSPASFSWKTKNMGQGNTFQPYWYDIVRLSQDSTCATPNDDQVLGSTINPSPLLAQAEYNSSLTYPVPNGTEGKRFVLVIADGYGGTTNETSETDNCRVAPTALMLELTPPPDLRVKANTVILPGVAGTLQAGASDVLEWDTENRGLGKNNEGKWLDRVYLSTDTVLNPFSDIYLGAVQHDTVLQVNSYTHAVLPCQFSENLGGTYYVFVQVDAYNDEYEHNFEFNNTQRFGPINIIAIPRPDFQVTNAPILPATADIGQQVTVQWQPSNQGANYSGNLTDQIILSANANMTGPITTLGQLPQNGTFPTGGSQNRQQTIQIPEHLAGNYFVAIRTDAYNAIQEGSLENNNLSPATPITIRSANLQVQSVNPVISSVVAGQPLALNWVVQNSGSGNLLNAAITDAVRLSPNANGSGGFPLGSFSATTNIFAGSTAARQQSFNVPITATPGEYFVVVRTNAGQLPVEGGQFGDNEKVSTNTVTITAASFPDLKPTQATATPDIAETGATLSVQYTATNQGQSNVQTPWTDQVYLSNSNTWGSGGIFLKNIQRAQVLAAGQNYSEQTTVALPQGLPSGSYFLFVVCDAQNVVFELNAEQNNVSAAIPITINNTIDANLQLYDLAVSANLAPGSTGTLQWKVRNNGTTATLPVAWTDRLYLSQDLALTTDDITVATWPSAYALGTGQSYARTELFQIPTSPNNSFYLILVTDPDSLSGDNFFDDNIQVLTNASGGGGGGPIVITFPPKPDLEVSSVSIAPSVQAGQQVKVQYSVRNKGITTATGNIVDGVYRSNDVQFNAGDALLNQKQRMLNLAPNASYSDSLLANVNGSDSGAVIFLVRTNLGNTIAEDVLLNNIGSAFTVVQQQPPGDLVVSQISVPAVVNSGETITATWRTYNQGSNPITGLFTEQLYWSKDTIVDSNDLLWGTLQHAASLPPGGFQNFQYQAQLAGLRDGNYRLLVKTDVYNQFVETSETNNTSAAAVFTEMRIPELPIAVTTPANLPLEEMLYYRIKVDNTLAGKMLAVQLKGMPDNGTFNELYLRFGDVPTRSLYDFAYDQPFTPDQLVYIPILAVGDYYLGAYALQGATIQSINLRADIVPYSITSIQANQGGNTGRITTRISGTKLSGNDNFWLKSNNGIEIEGEILPGATLFNGFVRFDLNNAPLGKYDVIAQNASNERDTILQGFEVVAGSVANTAAQLSCSFGNNTPLVLNGLEPIDFEVQHPPSARPGQIIPIVFRMENTGNIDIPIPQKILSSVGGAPISLVQDELGQMPQEVSLQFVEENGPPDVLRPGGVVFKTVYAKAVFLLQFNIY